MVVFELCGLADEFDEQREGDRADQHGDIKIANKSEGQCGDRQHCEGAYEGYRVHRSGLLKQFPEGEDHGSPHKSEG
jgi:hypothetical protein